MGRDTDEISMECAANSISLECPLASVARSVFNAGYRSSKPATAFVWAPSDLEPHKWSTFHQRWVVAAHTLPMRCWGFHKDFSDRLLKQEPHRIAAVASDTHSGNGIVSLEAPKLVVVCRNDLPMSAGKLAAQVAHAAIGAFRNHCSDQSANPEQNAVCQRWLAEGEKIVVLSTFKRPPSQNGSTSMAGPSTDRGSGARMLEAIIAEARALGLPLTQVCDAGHTAIRAHTLTCVAIGPAASGRIDAVTGDLHLYGSEKRQAGERRASRRNRRHHRRGGGR